MACEDGQEEHLHAARQGSRSAHRATCARKFGEIGDTRLTVMAALTVADELSEATGKDPPAGTGAYVRLQEARAGRGRARASDRRQRSRLRFASAAERIERHHPALNQTTRDSARRRAMRRQRLLIEFASTCRRACDLERTTLVGRGCEVRQEPYPRGLIDPEGSCP